MASTGECPFPGDPEQAATYKNMKQEVTRADNVYKTEAEDLRIRLQYLVDFMVKIQANCGLPEDIQKQIQELAAEGIPKAMDVRDEHLEDQDRNPEEAKIQKYDNAGVNWAGRLMHLQSEIHKYEPAAPRKKIEKREFGCTKEEMEEFNNETAWTRAKTVFHELCYFWKDADEEEKELERYRKANPELANFA
eukprot:TRINITY_DN73203_c0_g1_i1.p1 TRINITY_DN73203_c0_g1~~TRINITY_DN73203_c0_g1_i1.p1  ORF type:complete len:192 (-),score=42.18 TRINITY_DN73203_c0_g1_i1:30-605(-)